MSVKIVLENVIKRVYDIPASLDEFKNICCKVFPELENIRYDVLILEGTKKIIDNDIDYKEIVDNLRNKNIKFFIEKIINDKTVFNSKCNICSISPILLTKYVCFICDAEICMNCEKDHNHPLIKLKNDYFNDTQDFVNLMLSNNKFQQYLNIKSNFFSSIKNMINKKCSVVLDMLSRNYIIKQNNSYNMELRIFNDGDVCIPLDTIIYVKNIKCIYFELKKVKKIIWPGELFVINVYCKTSFEGNYEVEFHIYNREMIINYKPLKINIDVCDDFYKDDIDYGCYMKDDTVSTLPEFKKDILCEIIKKDLSTKDIIEICNILDKYNWKLSDEVISEIK